MRTNEIEVDEAGSVRVPGKRRREAAILDAAETLFGAHGFRKVTMGDVATAARVSRPLLYRYFSDKTGLLRAVVERVLREWNEVLVAEAARNTPGTAHTVRRVLVASLDFARQREVLRGLLGRDSRRVLTDSSDVIDRGSEMLRALMREILAAGMRRGDVRDDLDPDDLAHVVSEVFLAYADHIVRDGEELGERRVEAILETLLHGFVTAPTAARRTERNGGHPTPEDSGK
jgi:TetR/AcrR family transcriptional regulator